VNVLIDTNVVLDVLLDRQPYVGTSAGVLAAVEAGLISGMLGATTVTTVYYLAQRSIGVRLARRHLRSLLSMCDVAPVDHAVLREALDLGFPDYEDAVLHEAARRARASGIVTRDRTGFGRAELPVWSPDELLAVIKSGRE
jgi:predicted nucleic acid-binding protein